MSLVERTPTPGERLYAEWCDAPGSDGERYWIAMNRADKAAWEKLGARVAADRGAVSLSVEEIRALRMALRFGVPDPEPDLIRSARRKLEATELAAGGQ